MPKPYLLLCGLATSVFSGCSSPPTRQDAAKIQLAYEVRHGEKLLDLKGSKDWQPQWQDSLVAWLERGKIIAYDTDNQIIAPESLPRSRRYRGLVLTSGPEGVPLHAPRAMGALVPIPVEMATPQMELYFYDQSVGLEIFYARVRQLDVEKLTGQSLEFVPQN